MTKSESQGLRIPWRKVSISGDDSNFNKEVNTMISSERRGISFLLFFVLLLMPLLITVETLALESEQIAEIALASTVHLTFSASDPDKVGSTGSGFFVTEKLIATNYHVIEDQSKGSARLVGKSISYQIKGVIGINKRHDLAILKVDVEGIKPLSLGDSSVVKIGQKIYVTGNPRGYEGTFSDGIISGFDWEGSIKRIQITAPISRGSSGGPLLNGEGKVVGIVTSSVDAGQNLNFAIPSKQLKILLERSKNHKVQSLGDAKDIIITGLVEFTTPGDPFDEPEELKKAKRLLESEFNHNMGVLEHNSKRYYHAIGYYDKAIKLNPIEPRFYGSRAAAKFNLSMYIEAVKDYDIAIRYKPDNSRNYYSRGVAKYQLKQMKEAKRDFQKAAELAKKAKDETFYKTVANMLERMEKRY